MGKKKKTSSKRTTVSKVEKLPKYGHKGDQVDMKVPVKVKEGKPEKTRVQRFESTGKTLFKPVSNEGISKDIPVVDKLPKIAEKGDRVILNVAIRVKKGEKRKTRQQLYEATDRTIWKPVTNPD